MSPSSSVSSFDSLTSNSSTQQHNTSAASNTLTYYAQVHSYRLKIESECSQYCNELLQLLTSYVLPYVVSLEFVRQFQSCITHTIELYNRSQQSTVIAQTLILEEELNSELSLLEERTHFLSQCRNGESLVFYLKMMGDYRRFLAELSVGTASSHRQLLMLVFTVVRYHVASTGCAAQMCCVMSWMRAVCAALQTVNPFACPTHCSHCAATTLRATSPK